MGNSTGFCLFLLRATVFIVMLLWTLDKFFRPHHTASIFQTFYMIRGLTPIMAYILGGIELAVIVAFLFGWQKNFSYGLVLLLNILTTLAFYKQILTPFHGNNMMFASFLPMLAACITLFFLRSEDKMLTVGD